MTLTKNATNYNLQDKIGEVNVNGGVSVNEDGSINININTDNNGYISYSRDPQGYVNINGGFEEQNDLIDYMQSLVAQVFTELGI